MDTTEYRDIINNKTAFINEVTNSVLRVSEFAKENDCISVSYMGEVRLHHDITANKAPTLFPINTIKNLDRTELQTIIKEMLT